MICNASSCMVVYFGLPVRELRSRSMWINVDSKIQINVNLHKTVDKGTTFTW